MSGVPFLTGQASTPPRHRPHPPTKPLHYFTLTPTPTTTTNTMNGGASFMDLSGGWMEGGGGRSRCRQGGGDGGVLNDRRERKKSRGG